MIWSLKTVTTQAGFCLELIFIQVGAEGLQEWNKFPLGGRVSRNLSSWNMVMNDPRLRAVSLCSKIRGWKVAEHESRASDEVASSARGGRRAKRETAMVSYNDCEALWQFVSVTTPPIFNVIPRRISRAFISRLRMISGSNGCLWKCLKIKFGKSTAQRM